MGGTNFVPTCVGVLGTVPAPWLRGPHVRTGEDRLFHSARIKKRYMLNHRSPISWKEADALINRSLTDTPLLSHKPESS